MKFFTLIAMIASQVFAVNYIQEEIFGGNFSNTPGAIIVESGPAFNATLRYGNVTFISRTVSPTEIVDKYSIDSKGGSIGSAIKTMTVHTGPMEIGFGGVPFLEIKFELSLESEVLDGSSILISDNSLKIKSFQIVFDGASDESNVSEIYSNNIGLEWKIVPGPLLYTSYSRMENGGFVETPTSRFLLTVFPYQSTKVELKMYAKIPNGSGLINLYDPEIVIVPSTDTVNETVEDVESEVIEESEEEPILEED